MKNILVTGAAGFIGSRLCEELVRDSSCKVTGLDNFDSFYPRDQKEKNLEGLRRCSNFSFIEGDIRNISELNLPGNIDLVIHLAAKAGVRPSIDDPLEYASVNILGTMSILEWMKERRIGKFIFSSSSSVYGNNKKTPFSEDDNVDLPVSPYAASKKSGELFTHTYHHLYGIDVINLRFFTVYGPGQRPDLAIRKFIERVLYDRELEIYGDGSSARDYTYVDDIVQGIMAAVTYIQEHKGVYETINLGGNHPITLMELLDMIGKVTDKKLRTKRMPAQPGDVDRTFADLQKAHRLLGYHPETDIEEGIRNFVHWYKQNYKD